MGCYDNVKSPLSLFPQPSQTRCSGHRHCRAPVHVHCCYADTGACDSPDEHKRTTKHFGSYARDRIGDAGAEDATTEGSGMDVVVGDLAGNKETQQ